MSVEDPPAWPGGPRSQDPSQTRVVGLSLDHVRVWCYINSESCTAPMYTMFVAIVTEI